MKKPFVTSDVPPGKLNALVKNLMDQMGTIDPDEAVRRINSGEWVAKRANSVLARLYANDSPRVNGVGFAVYELVEGADFRRMFGSFDVSLEKLWMPVAKREAFCEHHRDKLRTNPGATFFLHKKDEAKPATPDNLEVADVAVNSDGLSVGLIYFENHNVWGAENRLRLVSPQLCASAL